MLSEHSYKDKHKANATGKYHLYQETITVAKHRCVDSETYQLKRWVVRRPNGLLVGYASTWFGAYRFLCTVMHWPVPR